MRLLKSTEIEAVDAAVPANRQDTRVCSLEGTIQRVNYDKRTLSVIAKDRAWHFTLSAEPQLWFDGRRAPFRCFQPLDHVRIVYESVGPRLVAEALYVWANEPGEAE